MGAYEIINYVNDVSLDNPQVLMTSNKDGNYTEADTYGLDRISVDYQNSTEDGKRDPLYYLYDGRGSVGQLTNSLGQVKDSYGYEAFGVPSHAGPLGNSATHFESYYGFNGEDYNSLTGLQYLRARYYEPESGTFLTRDSYLGDITQPLSLNRYAYAMNNPLMYTDPSGHMALDSEGNSVYSSGNHSNNSSVSSASSLPSNLLRKGSTGDAVKKLQQTLMGLGYDLGSYKDDGIFGSKTEQAVLAFQRNSGITIDGIVGNQTWAALAAEKSRQQSGGNKCDGKTEVSSQGMSNPDAYYSNNPVIFMRESDNEDLKELVQPYTDAYDNAKAKLADLEMKISIGAQRGHVSSDVIRKRFSNEINALNNQMISAEKKADAVRVTYYNLHNESLPDDVIYRDNGIEAPDITDQLNTLMVDFDNDYAGYASNKSISELKKLSTFYNLVKTGGRVDVKNSVFKSNSYYTYNGELYRRDDIENIYFGYAGKVFQYSDTFLKAGAGIYQVISGTSSFSYISSYGDDPRDSKMIGVGVSIYNSRH
jgi:RHS repeat-associated protein